MVIGGAIAAVVLLIAGVLVPLKTSVAKAQQRIGQKQADLSVDAHRGSGARDRGAGCRRATLAEIRCSSSSIARRVNRSSAARSRAASRRWQRASCACGWKAQFDILVGWLARLSDQHGIGVESATVDNAGAPGIVNAGLVLQIK